MTNEWTEGFKSREREDEKLDLEPNKEWEAARKVITGDDSGEDEDKD